MTEIVSTIIFSILFTGMILCILALFRNQFTHEMMINFVQAISRYCRDLIMKNKYDMSVSYYDEMSIGYMKYFWSIWLWKPVDCIKKEYQELISPFFDK